MTKAILRGALRLGPPSFRKEFGTEIEADFEEGLRDARSRGRFSAIRFALGSAWDVGRSGLGERWEERFRSPRRSSARRSRTELMMRGTIGQDLKLAWRGLRGSPAFTAVPSRSGSERTAPSSAW